jgi:hypothetical protein
VPVAPEPRDFSGSRAFADLAAIARIGPRETGSRGADRTRRRLRRELEDLGARVDERVLDVTGAPGDAASLHHVRGVLDGESPDVLLLIARYDTPPGRGRGPVDANSSAAGPALLLEVGRALAHRTRPYTVWLMFLDGDAGPRRGSESMANWLAAAGELERIRLAVYFEAVASRGLVIARDLRSQRTYREIFWQSARDLGFEALFPNERVLESPEAGHIAFLERGLRRVVAIVEAEPYVLTDSDSVPRGGNADTPATCSQESLQAVGSVSVEALDRIGARLRKIDHFSRPAFPTGLPAP